MNFCYFHYHKFKKNLTRKHFSKLNQLAQHLQYFQHFQLITEFSKNQAV